ncbi:MAG: hypothetical protein ACRCXL_14845 [Dermatophilaceae bacterium]
MSVANEKDAVLFLDDAELTELLDQALAGPSAASMSVGVALAVWREGCGRWLQRPKADPPLARHVSDVVAETGTSFRGRGRC